MMTGMVNVFAYTVYGFSFVVGVIVLWHIIVAIRELKQ